MAWYHKLVRKEKEAPSEPGKEKWRDANLPEEERWKEWNKAKDREQQAGSSMAYLKGFKGYWRF